MEAIKLSIQPQTMAKRCRQDFIQLISTAQVKGVQAVGSLNLITVRYEKIIIIFKLILFINALATAGFSPITEIVRYVEQVNKTLHNFEWASRTNMTAVPGKTFVLFSVVTTLQDPPKDGDRKRNYDDIIWKLRYHHRDVPIVVVSSQTNKFKDLVKEDQDLQQYGSINYDKVHQRICSNPATFQWIPCYNYASNGEEYIGYVSPGAKQNWAMYPEYFLKSFTITFTVCFDRNRVKQS